MRQPVNVMVLLAGIVIFLPFGAGADEHGSFSDRVQTAMEASDRPAKDKARDANRRPKETLEFFGVDSDQRVLELLPGGGWYTRLLAPALDGSGQLYLAFAGRMPDEVKTAPFMKNVTFLEVDATLEPTDVRGIFDLGPADFGVEDLDVVLTFRNLHNLTAEGRKHNNEAVFAALKPGGVYGVIDHTRRHNEADNAVNRRRVDPVQMILEIESVGFEFEAASDLHARPADGLDKEVGDESVTGKTDRVTLKFRKPKS